MIKEDLRVQKTKELIRQAYIRLISRKRLEKITVTELANEAKISKGSFYRYYQDVYDLYLQLTFDAMEEFLNSIDYYDLYFKDPKTFGDRFREDTEINNKSMQYGHSSFLEDVVDAHWQQVLLHNILRANGDLRFPKTLDALSPKFRVWLMMITYGDVMAFKLWPDDYEIAREVNVEHIHAFLEAWKKESI